MKLLHYFHNDYYSPLEIAHMVLTNESLRESVLIVDTDYNIDSENKVLFFGEGEQEDTDIPEEALHVLANPELYPLTLGSIATHGFKG